jgi:hypothetical protein
MDDFIIGASHRLADLLNVTARHQLDGLLSPVSPGWTSPQTTGSPVLFHEHEGISGAPVSAGMGPLKRVGCMDGR